MLTGATDTANQLATGFGKGALDTVAGVGGMIRGGIGAAGHVANALGIPDANTLADKAKEFLVPQQGLSAEQQMAVPHGGLQTVGYAGENLTEFLLGDEALKGLSLADKLKQVSQVAGIFEKSPRLMKTLQMGADLGKASGQLPPEAVELMRKNPVVARLIGAGMDAVRQGAVAGGQELVKTGGDVKKAAETAAAQGVASGVLGAAGSVVGGLGEKAATAENTVRPTTTNIAGIEVPTSALHADEPSLAAKAAGQVASPEGAEKFVTQQVQPKAVRAAVSNLDDAALNKVNELRATRGETPISHDPAKVQSIQDIAGQLKNEAQTTYKKFDAISDTLHDQWEKDAMGIEEKNAAALKDWNENGKFNGDPKPAAETVPPEPEKFSDLQAAIQRARKKIYSGAPNDAKEDAFDALEAAQKRLEDFADTHGKDAGVTDEERRAANQAHRTMIRYDWVGDRLSGAIKNKSGTTGASAADFVSIDRNALQSLPAAFEKKFGTVGKNDAFRAMIGPKAWDNYNKVIDALKVPIQRSDLSSIVHKIASTAVGGAAGTVAGGPVGGVVGATTPTWLANKLLFDPEVGGKFISMVRSAAAKAKPVTSIAGSATKFAAGQGLKNVLQGASQPLGEQ